MPSEFDTEMINQLERIAVALEGIAVSLADQPQPDTPFVFGDMPPRVRKDLVDAGDPRTCQAMLRIGRRRMIEDGRRITVSSAERYLDPVMDRLGFSEEWMAS